MVRACESSGAENRDMQVRRGRELIQLPGPTNIPEAVTRAMARPAEDFAAPEFSAMARGCLEDLKQVFATKAEVHAWSAVGHGGWEVALTNLMAPGDTALIPDTGRFATAWAEMARGLGIQTIEVPGDHRRPIDPNAIEDALRADPERRIRAVGMVQVETSTGILHDVQAVRAAIDAAGHPALLLVDAVASLGAINLPMDEWGVDLVLTASQKGLMLPPGLAFVAAGERAKTIAAKGGSPRKYWDWRGREGSESYYWFYGTPPMQMIHGLRVALDMLLQETMAGVHARHRRLAGAVRAAVEHWSAEGGVAFHCLVPAARSDVVTAIRFPKGGDPEAIRRRCRNEFSVAFGGGIGPFAGQLMRLGHLGDLNENMILGALGVLELALRKEGVAHQPGGVSAAVAALAEAS